ncbi:hypothetical protein MSP8887_01670 [Marinomonas spartinae]|uniref:hypothetical protein n=1 Tax=Marinomonas spartinae TaxID=1792290 RepID=UPI0008090B42|nr:hypothetical protein [Marinomonas spartinae]SBS32205.1 hypothetical protein MSP8887_01670 [Marinomonas spartinae]
MDYNIFGLNQYQIKSVQRQVSLMKYNDQVKRYISSVLSTLFTEIDKMPAIRGAGVCFVDSDDNVTKLRPAKMNSHIHKKMYVILREPVSSVAPSQFASYLREANAKAREEKFAKDLQIALETCVPIIIGWVVVIGTAAAAPLSGGATGIISMTVAAGSFAGAAMCANSLIRVGAESSGYQEAVDFVDQQEWYQETISALNIISLAGTAASSVQIFRHIRSLKRLGHSYMDILKGLKREDRVHLTEEILRLKNPHVNNIALKRMIRAGRYPEAFSNSVFRADVIRNIKDAVSNVFSVGTSFKSTASKPNLGGHLAVGIVSGENL